MKLKQRPVGIGRNLKRLRLRAGYSQSQLVGILQQNGLSISLDMYKKMEQDRYSIRVRDLAALRELYGVSYDEFFQGISREL
ncbi:MAG: helix-turn-helix transcriptional regulator [Eubacteriales bacterium]|nr:helix-turn-helix transcriptional regulator [Eubacteriales bacterium]